ncbi:hypothetical protein B296_00011021 [Ensete ventricosum]|uniref:Uncharacterized protein n=1 Tax=Ensete ventricosum TaxID=4639 RepID=A0A426ZMP5_ENSVE|nr:hypothetical protein B296_00011021 [Ensete ventricosum]
MMRLVVCRELGEGIRSLPRWHKRVHRKKNKTHRKIIRISSLVEAQLEVASHGLATCKGVPAMAKTPWKGAANCGQGQRPPATRPRGRLDRGGDRSMVANCSSAPARGNSRSRSDCMAAPMEVSPVGVAPTVGVAVGGQGQSSLVQGWRRRRKAGKSG